MKKIKPMIKYFKIFLSILVFASISGCDKDFEEMNQNPNAPAAMDPDMLFTYSLYTGMGSYDMNIEMEQRGIMQWMMYHGTLYGQEEGKEYYLPSSKDEFWKKRYTEALMNAQEVINVCRDDPVLSNKKAIAHIWKSYLFLQLADLWGDIPYSEALKGTSDGVLNPKYDKQENIYKGLIDELLNAAQILEDDPNQEDFGSADLVYSGDVNQWRKFANTLCMRIAMRISIVAPGFAQNTMNNLQDAEIIASNDDNAEFPFGGDLKNFLYEHYTSGEEFAVYCLPGKFIVDLLVNSNDPRLNILVTPAQVPIYGDYRGIPSLLPAGHSEWENYHENGLYSCGLGEWFLREDTPKLLMGRAETCFLLAEAVLNGWWDGNAQSLYEQGVEAAINYYNSPDVTQSDIDDYIQSLPPVSLEEIIKQKYIAWAFMDVHEAYAEYRRTGFPVLKDFWGEPINLAEFPKRFKYPTDEYFQNKEKVNEAVSRMGGEDSKYIKLWWDLN